MLLRIVLVIFLSFIASSAFAQQINGMQIDRGTQRPGSDYTKFWSKNAKHCARECANDYRCQAFDFDKNSRACYLKDRVPYGKQNWNVVSGVKVRDDYGSANTIDGFRLDRGLARTGSDFAQFGVRNVRQCARACANDYRCKAFDFNRNDRNCYLKDRVPALHRNQAVVSGVKQDNDYGRDDGFGGGDWGGGSIPAWAIGHFQGQNKRDRTPASIIISPSGDVNARWSGESHRGYFDGRSLSIDGLEFIVKRRGDGFETILRSDRGNRVYFHRQRY